MMSPQVTDLHLLTISKNKKKIILYLNEEELFRKIRTIIIQKKESDELSKSCFEERSLRE